MTQQSAWKKSSRCQGQHCVEVALPWQRSSKCESHQCVEVAYQPDSIMMRDSKIGNGSPVLRFGPAAWTAFLDSL